MKAELIPPTQPERLVTITMTGEEASVLKRIVGQIAGPDEGPRGVTEAAWRALADAGVVTTPRTIKYQYLQVVGVPDRIRVEWAS